MVFAVANMYARHAAPTAMYIIMDPRGGLDTPAQCIQHISLAVNEFCAYYRL